MTGGRAFRRQLARLERTHRGTTERVRAIIEKIAADGVPERANPIPGIGGKPVFKLRISIGHRGTRHTRLIFHYENGRVLPLFIYSKSDKGNVMPSEIEGALRAAGLYSP